MESWVITRSELEMVIPASYKLLQNWVSQVTVRWYPNRSLAWVIPKKDFIYIYIMLLYLSLFKSK